MSHERGGDNPFIKALIFIIGCVLALGAGIMFGLALR